MMPHGVGGDAAPWAAPLVTPAEVGTWADQVLGALDRPEVRFDEPAKALPPGHLLVLYDGAECLGGGPIQAVGQSLFEERRAAGATAGAVRRETPFVII